MSLLEKSKFLVNQVANSIASALEIEVVIIDKEYKVIGMSPLYSINQGITVHKSFMDKIFRYDFFIIDNPRENALCHECTDKSHCLKEAEIVCSIKDEDGQILGVIMAVAFNKEQKITLLYKKASLESFLKDMCRLIISQIKQTELFEKLTIYQKEMELLLETKEHGIAIIDDSNYIENCNAIFCIYMDSTEADIMGKNIFDFIEFCDSSEAGKSISFLNRGNDIIFVKKTNLYYNLSTQKIKQINVKKTVVILEPLPNYNDQNALDKIIGKSNHIEYIKNLIKTFAKSNSPVLIFGESGTGKELIAKAIHSLRNIKGKFIDINCASIPENLIESELFGYESGAFTSASAKGKQGLFEIAGNGTIFLDEIGTIPMSFQTKLLRVLQERKFRRVGSVSEIQLNAKIISATNDDLEKRIKEGTFREDLYYRINVLPINVMPLRNRREDILPIAEYYLNIYKNSCKKQFLKGFSPQVKEIFVSYDWPGNIRQLQNCIDYAVNLETTDYITIKSLPNWLLKNYNTALAPNARLKHLTENYEVEILKQMLKFYGSDLKGKKQIAQQLHISLPTLYRKISKIKEYEY